MKHKVPWKKKHRFQRIHSPAHRSRKFRAKLRRLYCSDCKVTLYEMIVQRFVIPKEARWLYKNKKALASVLRGLSQRYTIDEGSFA